MHSHTVTARRLAKLVGKLTATVLAVVPGPLFCRELQMLKTKSLLKSQQNYEARVTLTPECKAELMWWAELLEHHNGQSFIVTSPDLVITTDALKTGWGAVVEEVKTQAGSLEDQWQEGPDSALSEDTASMLLRSRRDGTRKAYQHPWEEWTRWCDERQADPIQAPVEMIANFLTERFKQGGLEYRTLNVYRSAISAYHEPLLGQPVGQHQVITRLLKGMFNSRPPQPKYTDTWDVQLVLDRLRRLPDNAQLDLKELSLKVVMLLALITASRVSELHKLNMSNMCDKGDAVEFHIGDLTKTRKVGDGPLLIQLTQYEKESKLDVDLTHTLEFLGLLVNSVDMTLALPLNKDQDIRERWIEMHSHTVTARRLAKLVGKLTATVLAVVPGPLFCRELQMLKTKGLLKSQQNYEARVTLTPGCKAELMWWAELLEHHNGQSYYRDLPRLSDHNRRVEDRLGSSGGGGENTGCMVGSGVTTTHQLPQNWEQWSLLWWHSWNTDLAAMFTYAWTM